jgi:hypothetical protein
MTAILSAHPGAPPNANDCTCSHRPLSEHTTFSKQSIEPERIPDTESIGRRVVVEAEGKVEVDLLVVSDPIASPGIEQVTGASR